jgi:hypothetical protein
MKVIRTMLYHVTPAFTGVSARLLRLPHAPHRLFLPYLHAQDKYKFS